MIWHSFIERKCCQWTFFRQWICLPSSILSETKQIYFSFHGNRSETFDDDTSKTNIQRTSIPLNISLCGNALEYYRFIYLFGYSLVDLEQWLTKREKNTILTCLFLQNDHSIRKRGQRLELNSNEIIIDLI